MTVALFNQVCNQCSRIVTRKYSTSFSSAIKLLDSGLHAPIYNIYGFVRFADEIVDTFHEHDKPLLLQQFKEQAFEAIERKISLNPVLHAFQYTVNQYQIDHILIHAFFRSMESDLTNSSFNRQGYDQYIYGSAEVVGLMCLYVFCNGNRQKYAQLEYSARALGAAFQKVNFLRDMKDDFNQLSRVYFPDCNFSNFSVKDKQMIEAEIEADFSKAFSGILQLPVQARFGVYVAYKYYYALFKIIKTIQPAQVLQKRIRIANHHKALILFKASIKNQFGII
ncbi:MAG TPA: squalene/phytoene synthase family protein [Flavobacterium sp.]|jgi:phytoene/squalene synthetase